MIKSALGKTCGMMIDWTRLRAVFAHLASVRVLTISFVQGCQWILGYGDFAITPEDGDGRLETAGA